METKKAIADLIYVLAKSDYEKNERRLHRLFDIHEGVQHLWTWDREKFSDEEKNHIARLEHLVRSLLEEMQREILDNTELCKRRKGDLPFFERVGNITEKE